LKDTRERLRASSIRLMEHLPQPAAKPPAQSPTLAEDVLPTGRAEHEVADVVSQPRRVAARPQSQGPTSRSRSKGIEQCHQTHLPALRVQLSCHLEGDASPERRPPEQIRAVRKAGSNLPDVVGGHVLHPGQRLGRPVQTPRLKPEDRLIRPKQPAEIGITDDVAPPPPPTPGTQKKGGRVPPAWITTRDDPESR